MEKQILLTSEVAAIFGVSPDTIRLSHKNGVLAADRTAGGVRVFRRQDVEALARERVEKRNGRSAA